MAEGTDGGTSRGGRLDVVLRSVASGIRPAESRGTYRSALSCIFGRPPGACEGWTHGGDRERGDWTNPDVTSELPVLPFRP